MERERTGGTDQIRITVRRFDGGETRSAPVEWMADSPEPGAGCGKAEYVRVARNSADGALEVTGSIFDSVSLAASGICVQLWQPSSVCNSPLGWAVSEQQPDSPHDVSMTMPPSSQMQIANPFAWCNTSAAKRSGINRYGTALFITEIIGEQGGVCQISANSGSGPGKTATSFSRITRNRRTGHGEPLAQHLGDLDIAQRGKKKCIRARGTQNIRRFLP